MIRTIRVDAQGGAPGGRDGRPARGGANRFASQQCGRAEAGGARDGEGGRHSGHVVRTGRSRALAIRVRRRDDGGRCALRCDVRRQPEKRVSSGFVILQYDSEAEQMVHCAVDSSAESRFASFSEIRD